MTHSTPLTVAVVGATGVVGRTMVQVLGERGFPIGELRLLASGRSAGRTRPGRRPDDRDPGGDAARRSTASTSRCSAPARTSRGSSRPQAAARGATVIDNSSAWRMEPDRPARRQPGEPGRPRGPRGHHRQPQLLDDAARARAHGAARRGRASSASSSTPTSPSPAPGADAIAELEGQIRAHVAGEPKQASVYPHPIAFNALPEIDIFLDNGYTKEEWKVVTESRKILHLPELRISCTAVRVPVFVSHSEAVHVETRDADHAGAGAAAVRRACAGVVVQDDPAAHEYPLATTPPGATRSSSAGSARTRRSPDGRGLAFWVVSDNLRKGAATNAVELAEVLVERGWVRAAIAAASRRSRRPRDGRREATTDETHRRSDAKRVARRSRRSPPRCAPARAAASRRRGRRPCPARATPTPRSCSSARARARPRTSRAGRSSGRAGDLLVKLLSTLGWRREEVFITNIVKCRPPGNRDPEPDEIAACAPYLQRQLEVLDPAVVVTLGRFSMGHFRPGERITQIHGTAVRRRRPRPGARDALAFALFHPAAALRSTEVERQSYDDIARLPRVLIDARARAPASATRQPPVEPGPRPPTRTRARAAAMRPR